MRNAARLPVGMANAPCGRGPAYRFKPAAVPARTRHAGVGVKPLALAFMHDRRAARRISETRMQVRSMHYGKRY